MFFVSYDDALETVLHGSACVVDQCTFSSLGQFCILTPPSVALYAMALCMIKWEARPFMQTDSAYSVDSAWLC